jgi:predicted permease
VKGPVEEELEFHIEERTRELIAEGHDPVEARRRAEAAFGDRPQIEAQVQRLQRKRERLGSLRGHTESIRHGINGLFRQPGYAYLVAGTLALGLGATVAIFSVVNAVLLEPLPFERADELLTIYETDPERVYRNPAPADFFDIRNEVPAFSSVTAFVPRGGNLIGDGDPERVRFGDVSANFFETLGVRPFLGRSFGPETVPGGVRVAVISHGLWTRRYGNDPDIVGRRINLDESLYEIVGVAPEGFDYPAEVSLWVAAPYDVPVASFLGPDAPSLRDAWFHTVVGRLAPEQGPEIAGDQLAALASRLREDYAEEFGEAEIFVEAIRDSEVGDLRAALLLLMGATGLVLLIVSANVANLALVRAAGRGKEWGVRLALGAPRSRIITLILTESLTLAVVGGGLGVLLAWAGVEALRPLVVPLLPVTTTLGVDGTAMGFALALAVAVALAFGLVPALSAAGRSPATGIDRGAGSRSGSKRERRMRELLVTAEIALAVVLVMGGGLLLRSLVSLQKVDLGFDPAPLSTLSVGFPGSDELAPEE